MFIYKAFACVGREGASGGVCGAVGARSIDPNGRASVAPPPSAPPRPPEPPRTAYKA